MVETTGFISKMQVTLAQPVKYEARLGEQLVALNPLIGEAVKLSWSGKIACQHCGRASKKSYSQGYCYPCFKKLAQCDLCVMSPDRCHYDKGTCREPAWGEEFCMQSHLVYLANSSGIKVGITKPSQIPTRWIDQGAMQGLLIWRTQTRQLAGLVEMAYKNHISDRTQWQKLLQGKGESVDLVATRDELATSVEPEIRRLQDQYGIQAIQPIEVGDVQEIDYPVTRYPEKVKSLNFDKTAEIEGTLQGIKGQYLIFDIGVINLRKFTSYEITLSTASKPVELAPQSSQDLQEQQDLFS